MNPLCELGAKYGTDKCNHVAFPNEDLTCWYDKLFGGRRSEIKKVLEIGIGTVELMRVTTGGIYGAGNQYRPGASLFMWADYFPQAEIFALELDKTVLINEGRIHSYQCDQSNGAALEEIKQILGTDFDIIIDDGSHVAEHQVLTANVFRSLLAPNGVYIIEDVVANSEKFVQHRLQHFSKKPFYDTSGRVGDLCFIFENKRG